VGLLLLLLRLWHPCWSDKHLPAVRTWTKPRVNLGRHVGTHCRGSLSLRAPPAVGGLLLGLLLLLDALLLGLLLPLLPLLLPPSLLQPQTSAVQ
jgi:hypothetical protein